MNPNDPNDAALDLDGDGTSSLAEYLAGTNPGDAADTLRARLVLSTGGVLAVRFTAVAGRSYSVEYKNAPTDSQWQLLSQVPASSADVETEVVDNSLGGREQRFYRVVTPQR